MDTSTKKLRDEYQLAPQIALETRNLSAAAGKNI